MTIEQQALALVNEVRAEEGRLPLGLDELVNTLSFTPLCRALERHEAFRQEVSEAVQQFHRVNGLTSDALSRFIIAPPVDPVQAAAMEILLADSVTRTDHQIAAIKAGNAGQDKIALIAEGIKRGMELAKHGLAIRKEA